MQTVLKDLDTRMNSALEVLAANGVEAVIQQDDGGEDVFVHHTAIQMDGFRTLAEGQKVQFDVSRGPKGLQAQNVKPV